MIETIFTKKTGVKYPIIAGTMMNIAIPEYVAACSNAGVLGVLASAIYKSTEEFEEAVVKTKSLTKKPFAVNINYFPTMKPADNESYIRILAKHGIKIIISSGHQAPENHIPIFKELGITWIHKCAALKHAIKGASLGADMISIVGFENGGATGKFENGLSVLIPACKKEIKKPIIAGGGISSGEQLAAMLCLGASAVNIGTRFLISKESPIHDDLKIELSKADYNDTVLVMKSINSTHRVWNNKAAQKILDLESKKASLEEIIEVASGENAKKMYYAGDLDAGIISCGQGIGFCNEIFSIKDIVKNIIHKAEKVLKQKEF